MQLNLHHQKYPQMLLSLQHDPPVAAQPRRLFPRIHRPLQMKDPQPLITQITITQWMDFIKIYKTFLSSDEVITQQLQISYSCTQELSFYAFVPQGLTFHHNIKKSVILTLFLYGIFLLLMLISDAISSFSVLPIALL